ncbi:MAG: hypothetical protein J1F33_08450 [Clostridiales bacterium]|nr:hypothetical protein [Clostridiales bacterium]
MRKTKGKIALTSFLVVLFTLVCAVFLVACEKEETTKKYTVTWTLDNNVKAVEIVDGPKYAQKMEVSKGTKISFKLTFNDGWEAGSVKAGKSTVRPTNGVYTTAAVTENLEISVVSAEQLDHIEAALADENAVFYAGDVLTADDIVVTAYYKTNRHEEVTGTISYQQENAEALSLGDTKFYVSYPGADKVEVEFDEAVKGLIKLNLNGGTISGDELAKLPEGYMEGEDYVAWTFAAALTADVELPVPTLLIDPEDPTSGLPFERWSGTGVTNNKIPSGTKTSVTAGASYTTTLVNVTKMGFELDQSVPYLYVMGEFVAANSAYLYLYEGNDPPKAYDPHITVEKQPDNNGFNLRLNLADLAKAEPEYMGDGEKPDNFPESLIGVWLDIRFCLKLGNTTIMQELFLSDDNDYADLNDQVVAKVDEKYYRFFFESWTPEPGGAITGGNGAQFTGTEKILKLHYEETAPYMQTGVALEKKTFEGTDEAVYLVVSGKYIGELQNKEDLESKIAAIYIDLQNNDGANHKGWGMYLDNGSQKVDVDYNEQGDSTFKIYLSLAGLNDGDVAFSHFGASNTNLVMKLEESSIVVGTITYTLKNWTGWGSQLVCVFVDDSSAKKASVTEVDLVVEGEKLLYVITFAYRNYTKAEIEALTVNFDLQTNDNIYGGGWDRNKNFDKTITVNEEDGTFTIKFDISSLITTKRAYTSHLSFTAEGDAGDFKPDIDAFSKTVVFGEWKVEMVYVKGSGSDQDFWGCVGIKVNEANAAKYTVESFELEERDGKAVMVIKGKVEGYEGDAKAYIATVLNGDPWPTVARTEDGTITVDDEGNFTVVWDLSALEDGRYWIHFGGRGEDLPSTTINEEKITVTVGNKTYTIIEYRNAQGELKTGSPEIQVSTSAAAE